MRQTTLPEQTAKPIELGFEKPKSIVSVQISWTQQEHRRNTAYSIGELIELLPRTIKLYYNINILCTTQGWWVLYGMIGDGDMWSVEYELYRKELIDALYMMILRLKEDGVI